MMETASPLEQEKHPEIRAWDQYLQDLVDRDTIFREAFTHAAIGMALVGTDGSWLHVNTALCTMLGYTAEELRSLRFQDLTHADDLLTDLEYVDQMLAGDRETYQMEKRYLHKDGSLIWALLSVSLVRNAYGQPLYFISQIQNISRQHEARFRTLFDQSPDSVTLVDPISADLSGVKWRIIDVNTATCTLTGYTRDELIGQPLGLINIPTAASKQGPLRLAALRRGETVRAEIGVRHKNGTISRVLLSISRIMLEGRELLMAIVRDTTALQQAEQAIHEANRQLHERIIELEQHMGFMKLLNDTGEWLHACQNIEEVTTVVVDAMTRIAPMIIGAIYLFDEHEQVAQLVSAWGSPTEPPATLMLSDCLALRERHVQLNDPADAGSWCAHVAGQHDDIALCIPLIAFGHTIGVLQLRMPPRHAGGLSDLQQQIMLSIAEHSALTLANLQLREALRRQAVRDVVTGLYNRRYMEESLTQAIIHARRHTTAVGVLMFDIDHFKRFNDTFGHPAGDAILRAIAGYLYAHIRGADIACRYGGEEFLVIMPDTDGATLERRAGDLLEGMRSIMVEHDGLTLGSITVSIGIALFPDHAHDTTSLIAAADQALYRAKHNGRDCVVLAAL
ncbi:MAG TPA: diguanylate cyclase [Roseiflexaceae bacterium]|nr:diguanylate cyclase [Roseiflexaceae bacterium]HMP40577.1 diguanylate cyclase [Roseiflexaceae bacterium]